MVGRPAVIGGGGGRQRRAALPGPRRVQAPELRQEPAPGRIREVETAAVSRRTSGKSPGRTTSDRVKISTVDRPAKRGLQDPEKREGDDRRASLGAIDRRLFGFRKIGTKTGPDHLGIGNLARSSFNTQPSTTMPLCMNSLEEWLFQDLACQSHRIRLRHYLPNSPCSICFVFQLRQRVRHCSRL